MRLFGLLCVCAAVVCGGVFLVSSQRRSAEQLAGFAAYFECLAFAAGQHGGDSAQLIRVCAGRAGERFAFPKALMDTYAEAGDLCASWARALEACGAARYLGEEVFGELLAFGPAFASQSLAEFQESCGRYAARLDALAAAAAEKLRREEKLIIPMASLLAALLFIILV